MLKRLIAALSLAVGMSGVADDLILDNFAGNPNCVWQIRKGEAFEKASFVPGQGKMLLDFGIPKEEGKGGSSIYVKLNTPQDIGGYRYISFKARSLGGVGNGMRFYIRRENPDGKFSSFYSLIPLTDAWKTYDLKLESAHRSMAGKGVFAMSKADPGASRKLDGSGKLCWMTFNAGNSLRAEISDIVLKKEIRSDNGREEAIVGAMKAHPKYPPYKFGKILSSDGPILAKDARSQFVIYADRKTGKTGRFAAEQLAGYIRKSTGAELKIVERIPSGVCVIELTVSPAGDRKEGFRTEALTSEKIVISGNDERGLLYGVYDFLEKGLGIRWLAPFDYAEIVPRLKEVKLPLWKDESSPKMFYRRFHYCSSGRDVPDPTAHRYAVADWCVKNRYNVELERLAETGKKGRAKDAGAERIRAFYAERGGYIELPEMWGHNYHYWVPPKEFFASHPEYYCFDSSSGKWQAEMAQLCATNPEVVKVIVARAVEFFKQNPDREFFPLFQEDGSRLWCQCPNCRALYKGRDMNVYKTEHSIHLANQVAAELARAVPGKKVATYAYSVSSQPPVNVKPRSDVFITYCLMDFSKPDKYPWRDPDGRELSEWIALSGGNLILYTYNYLDIYYTANTPESLVRLFRYFDLEKIRCSCQESNENWYGVSAYNYYLSARLAWDPWFDSGEFRRDYYDKLYGKAAAYIVKYHDVLEECLSDKKCWLEYGNRTLAHIPPEKQRIMEQCIADARAAAAESKDERVIAAVKAQEDGFGYVRLFSSAVLAGNKFQMAPDEAGYGEVVRSLDLLDAKIKQLAPARLVPIRALRQSQGMRRNMNENYSQLSDFKRISGKYEQVGPIPGPWGFTTDPRNEGDKEEWFAAGFDDSGWKKIKVGDFWNNQGWNDYIGSGWYRTVLELPAGNKRMALYFCGADERAWVYLDGRFIGGHYEGAPDKLWVEPFLIRLPEGLTPGRHQLTVKVHSRAGKGGLWKEVVLLREK